MSILSVEFLLFALCVVLLYYLLPLRVRWVTLLAASAVYVGLSGWSSAVHLTAVALLMWGGGLLLARRRSRLLLGLLTGLDISAMLLLKYAPALADGDLLLPVGLSYFTFQSAGYLIDVYRGKTEAQRNPLKAWLFVGYFPQLIQGPISTWRELGPQLTAGHRLEPERMVSGFQLLLWGYFKKLVIADRLAATTEALLQGSALPGWFVLGGVALYTIRLYMDFSGGMDVVRGLSRMVGIELPENFRRPFFARSVADYWRRWHITLGAWFRTCLLYPLTTSRAGIALGRRASALLGKRTGRTLPGALATLLVFLLIGLWHAANWNAVIYGGYFGLVMAASMLLEPVWKTMRAVLRLPRDGWMTPLRLARTWGLILLAQYFAFTTSPQQGLALLRQTFAPWSFAGCGAQLTAVMAPLEWLIAGAGCAVVLAVDILCERKVDVCGRLARAPVALRWPALLLLILAIAVFGMYGTGYSAADFLYTQF
ncbi:MAG: MBOAT family O-acyltransferase [Aristaeellaceae bacterium]